MPAVVNLKVQSDFKKASKDIKTFGNISEAEAKRIKKYQDAFTGEQVDKFIDKNRRAGAAAKATSGNVKSLAVQQRALNKEMQRLIKAGLDPQDESVQRLRKEYERLDKEVKNNENSQKGMTMTTQGATKSLIALGVAALAIVAGIAKSSVEIGKMGDNLAKTSAKVGVGIEALQELSFAAERSGLPANSLSGIFQKLNRNIGDLQAGTGTLTTFLNKSNPALLQQLKTVDDSEEAFNILIDAIAKAPTQFDKAALSQAAFGRAGQDIINFANQGTEEITKLREAAKGYGLLSEEVARQGEEFVDSQRNLSQSLIGVRSELASNFLPIFTTALNKIADFIADGDRLKTTLEIVGIALAGVTAGLVTFLIITKGAAAIQAFAVAFRVLNAAIAANPIAFIATVIITILIPAIILLVKNWDFVVVIITTTLEKLKERFILFGNAISTAWIKAVNNIKIIFLSLAGLILEKVLGAVNKFLDLAQKLPFVGEKFADLQENVNGFAAELDSARLAAIRDSEDSIKAAEERRAALKITTAENIANIEKEKQARLASLEAQKKANEEAQKEAEKQDTGGAGETTGLTNVQKAADERLRISLMVEDAIKARDKRIEENEKASLERRKEFYLSYSESIITGFTNLLGAIDQLNQVQLQNQIANIDARLQAELESKGLLEETERERLERELKEAFAAGDLVKIKEKQDAIERSKIVEKFEREKAQVEYKAALASWHLQLVSSIASGAAAVAKTLSSVPFPLNIPLAVLQGVASGVQIAGVASAKPQPPAFAEGASFRTKGPQQITVGDNIGGVEDVEIKPVSSNGFNAGGGGTMMKLVIGEQEFDAFLIESTQDAIDNQELRRAAGGEI